MAQFTTLNLTGDRVLVKGTDNQGTNNETVLDGSEWTEVKKHSAFHEASSEFDAAVEQFFAPLTAAAERLDLAFASPKADPISYVVLHEGTEAQAGVPEHVVRLSPDSIVLRLIENGDTDRLIWVGDKLEVLEVIAGTQSPTVNEVLGDAGIVNEDGVEG